MCVLNRKEISTPRVADRLKFYLIYTPVLYSCSHYPKALSLIVVVLHRKVRIHWWAFRIRALSPSYDRMCSLLCVCFLQVSHWLQKRFIAFFSLYIPLHYYFCTRLTDSYVCIYLEAGSYKTRLCYSSHIFAARSLTSLLKLAIEWVREEGRK